MPKKNEKWVTSSYMNTPRNDASSLTPQSSILDLLIIGGGINGAGIAADAAGRGLKVALCEQNDLGSGTSSKSSKLIHGGLRYLEQYDFKLVHKALREREILMQKAPHIIWPQQFIMPYDKRLRPAWLIRLGLFLYDHLGKRKLLPTSKKINLSKHLSGAPVLSKYKMGFSYFDCYADDARLVILNAIQAKELGAIILPRTQLINAQRYADYWQVTLQNTRTHEKQTLNARILINATGPWVENVLNDQLQIPSTQHLTLVKGSHIVVPKLYEGTHAYILQNDDKRIIFIIPFENEYHLIGTTDMPFTGDLNHPEITSEEIEYLCSSVNRYFKNKLSPTEILWTYAGVRPLKNDHTDNLSSISRDYDIEINAETNGAPLLNIFGGKLTTYRELAEQALNMLKSYFPTLGAAWTAKKSLPGGNIPEANFAKFYEQLQKKYSWLPSELVYRYARNYGTLIHDILKNTHALKDLGQHFGAGLYEKEVIYLIKNEWTYTVEDILWRRTKLGLSFPEDAIAELEKFLIERI